jgi:multidrug efflux pump subunit AcrA (membrane-fusion protein)
MRAHWLVHLSLAAFAIFAAAAAPGCGGSAAKDETSTEAPAKVVLAVSAARVIRKPMRQGIAIPGVTAALRTLTVRAPAPGRVVGLDVTTGDAVHKGEVIGHVISREEEAAQAGLAIAQKIDPSEAASLAHSVDRYTSGPGIPVRVPQNAIVSQRLVAPGQLVNEFDPLVDMVDPSSVYVDAQALINQLGEIHDGMQATVVSPLKPGRTFAARVWSISPSFSTGGTTAPVWVKFTSDHLITEIGAAVEVHVVVKSVPDAIVIPAAALFRDAAQNSYYVFTVGPDSRAHRVVVGIGIRTRSEVQVTHGLKPGELVITSGGYALSDGLEVHATTTS